MVPLHLAIRWHQSPVWYAPNSGSAAQKQNGFPYIDHIPSGGSPSFLDFKNRLNPRFLLFRPPSALRRPESPRVTACYRTWEPHEGLKMDLPRPL